MKRKGRQVLCCLQKRPTIEAKETYHRGKRDLLQRQGRTCCRLSCNGYMLGLFCLHIRAPLPAYWTSFAYILGLFCLLLPTYYGSFAYILGLFCLHVRPTGLFCLFRRSHLAEVSTPVFFPCLYSRSLLPLQKVSFGGVLDRASKLLRISQ